MKASRIIVAALGVSALVTSMAGCSRESATTAASSTPTSSSAAPTAAPSSSAAGSTGTTGGDVLVGVDQPRSDSDFWSAFATYVPPMAGQEGVTLEQTSSDNDANRLKSNVDTLISKGVNALVLAPQDTATVGPALNAAADAGVPVVSVDTRPEATGVYMVVRADNRAYGTNSCVYLGETLGGKGKVVEFQGSLSSINGRDRSEAFAECMASEYPDITVIEIPTEWSGDKAASGLQDKLLTDPDINGIYMQAGGVFLQPTLALLKREGKLVPRGEAGHITIISNDGIASELDAIRSGEIDATISQPADAYAQYALYYAKAAAEGRTFTPGPTDHDSTIITTDNGTLEDQLPAPVVTVDGATVGELETVAADSDTLWGNAG